MYKVSKETYLDSFTKCYKNIITLSSIPDDSEIKKYIKTIARKSLSPFKTFDCCEKSYCTNAFIDTEKAFITLDKVDVVINILTTLGYSVNYDLTKIMLKNKSSLNVLFYIKKN